MSHIRADAPGMQPSRRNWARGATGYSRSDTLDLCNPEMQDGVSNAELQQLEEQKQRALKLQAQEQPQETTARGVDTSRNLQQIPPAAKSKLPKSSPGAQNRVSNYYREGEGGGEPFTRIGAFGTRQAMP